ncbi:MAG: Abi family protein [Oscillospiraceae bacterium]|nr:Abi family protein [Oscillospiraceae bacterium]MCL2279913.1 Abi family protein [Oscillospiraceae bacterium]
MAKGKPFLTYTQQLDKLADDKNLVINDRDYAESVLKHIGYYSLISGYKKLFRNPTTRKFKDNTTFDEIVASMNPFNEPI